MPELDGLQATRRILAADNAARILILTTFDLDEYVFEALRFNPHNPLIVRRCLRDARLGSGSYETNVRAGSTVYALTLSAMFDKDVFAEPETFRIDRPRDAGHLRRAGRASPSGGCAST